MLFYVVVLSLQGGGSNVATWELNTPPDQRYYVSQCTVEIYCFADDCCLFKQARSVIYHWNQYGKISRKFRFVRLSVSNANKKAYSSLIINSRILIRISNIKVWHLLQENKAIFKKYIFFNNFRPNFRKLRICLKYAYSSSINSRIIICKSDERAWLSTRKLSNIFNIYIHFRQNVRKIMFLLTASVLLAVVEYFPY